MIYFAYQGQSLTSILCLFPISDLSMHSWIPKVLFSFCCIEA